MGRVGAVGWVDAVGGCYSCPRQGAEAVRVRCRCTRAALAVSRVRRFELSQAVAPLARNDQLEGVMTRLASKATIEQALATVDKKANIEDINRSLTEVTRRHQLGQRVQCAR